MRKEREEREQSFIIKFLTWLCKSVFTLLLIFALLLGFLSNFSVSEFGLGDGNALDFVVGYLNAKSGQSFADENGAPSEDSFLSVKEQFDSPSFKYSDLLDKKVYFAEEKTLSFSDSEVAALINLVLGKNESDIKLSASVHPELRPIDVFTSNENSVEVLADTDFEFFVDSFTSANKDGVKTITTAVSFEIPKDLMGDEIPSSMVSMLPDTISLKVTTKVNVTDGEIKVLEDGVVVETNKLIKTVLASSMGDDSEIGVFLNGTVASILNNLGVVDGDSLGSGKLKIKTRIE